MPDVIIHSFICVCACVVLNVCACVVIAQAVFVKCIILQQYFTSVN